jgi:predicted alpha/beta-fold hydrolase
VSERVGPYRAPWWLPGGHLQTLYAVLCAPRPCVRYRRERWETPDGDFVDVDWLARDEITSKQHSPPVPLLALFHGLEGGSTSHYAHALMAHVRDLGWRGAVVHFRGCGGEPNRLARAYHSGDSDEIDWMLRRFAQARANAPLFATGVSLGGNALLKWLGERARDARPIVTAAAAVSAPLDLMCAGDALGRGFNRIYTRHFLATLKKKSLAKLRKFPDIYDARRVRAARTLRAFDDVVTAPLHGFRDTDDYWTRASSKPWLARIEVPTLVVNARNDPFMPARALPQAAEVSGAVTCDFPAQGGHVGFVSGPFPGHLDWLPRRIIAFLLQHIPQEPHS